ncbi:signal peptide containing protein [Theileria equi strain WA]|uniref:Signal peptide containing protein n=1 Tax=Theileria equi strain WA TaxID=1537102 RepID=L1LEX8_THEEQ|nr:signal peptide containing protein [Theileria equi strain WA]EKX73780.1 signal peptide containing protein [Theileria equi strain WA]|eukprot:XP_004833232.1 signal peptide containing protein [Theileria equi strain WA]
MGCVLYLFIFTSLVGTLASTSPLKATSRDGPIGLPNNVILRASKTHRRRHNKEMIENTNNEYTREYTKQLENIARNSTSSIKEMSQAIAQDQRNGIITNGAASNVSPNFDYVPEWLQLISTSLQSPKEFIFGALTSLTSMGLSTVLQNQAFKNVSCTLFSTETEKAICMTQSIDNINNIVSIGTRILSLNFRILSGGRIADDALVALDTLATDHKNVNIIKSLGSTVVLYITLMRESVPDE